MKKSISLLLSIILVTLLIPPVILAYIEPGEEGYSQVELATNRIANILFVVFLVLSVIIAIVVHYVFKYMSKKKDNKKPRKKK